MREGVVTGEHGIERRRANGKGPHVRNHTAQSKSATRGLLTGAVDRAEGDVGAHDPEAECCEPEGLRADSHGGVEDAMRR